MRNVMIKEEKIKLVNSKPAWMYEFDLGDGLKTPLLAEELRSVHQTRERMVMPLVDKIFSNGLGGKYCLDVACNEGYFSHLLYHRGAKVRGIDIRETNIQRAKAVQGVYGYDPQRLIFQVEDFFSHQDEADTYDLTLFLGLLYHIENPMGALRLLHKITKTLCVIDTQLTRQNIPIISGWGQTSVVRELAASMALLQEEDMKENNLAAYTSLSFIPNAAAVRQLLFSAGFSQVLQVAAHPSLNQQYVNNDRGVFLAFK
jgi:tRNA (mo5U34)-methyltransferase